MSTLELQGIGKSYNAIKVLEHVDLQVAPGSRTAIVGPSGSGKPPCCASSPASKYRTAVG